MHQLRSLLILLLAAAFTIPVHAQDAQRPKKLLVQGTVVGYDGKPVPVAHAHFERIPEAGVKFHLYEVRTTAKGSYMMKLPPGKYNVMFTGVNHQRTTPREVLVQDGQQNTLHARLPLSPFVPVADMDSVHLCYDDDWSGRDIDTLMEKTGEGQFSMRVRVRNLMGHFCYHVANTMPDRRVNGTQQDYYDYDGDGDYMSCIGLGSYGTETDTTLTIHFDARLLPYPTPEFPMAYQDSVWGPMLETPRAKLIAELEAIDAEKRSRSFFPLPKKSITELPDSAIYSQHDTVILFRGDSIHLSDTTYVWEIREGMQRLADLEQSFSDKIATASSVDKPGIYLRYLHALRASSIRRLSETGRKLAEEALESIPPDSDLWELSSSYTLSRYILKDSLHYLLRMAREHPSDEIAYNVFENLLSNLRSEIRWKEKNQQSPGALPALRDSIETAAYARIPDDRYHGRLVFAAHGNRAMNAYMIEHLKANLEKETAFLKYLPEDALAGETMPAFQFESLTDEEIPFSSAVLAGSPYILIMWSVESCGLTSLLSIYDDLFRRYHDQGLEIVNIISSKSKAKAEFFLDVLNEYEYAQQWYNCHHSTGSAFPMEKWLVHPLTPMVLLVDELGRIVASGEHISGSAALVTVPKFFEDRSK
ncbi:carboxypeptidase-like regulatory domain-containing protein [bacterium]|nr:carboxypeptidase-like regulatory domain-containing protein [bacterium]